jgi:hypothetical protein
VPETAELTLNLREEHYPFWSKGKVKEAKRVDFFAKETKSEIAVVAHITDVGKPEATDTLVKDKDTILPGLRGGKLAKIPLPKPIHSTPEEKLTLYFNDNTMDDLLILLTWGKA